METWHKRLDFALKARGKGWADLVSVTGKKKPSVYAWKPDASKRTEMMNADNAAKVCEWLGINSKWLFENVGPSGLEDHPSEAIEKPGQSETSQTAKHGNLVASYQRADAQTREVVDALLAVGKPAPPWMEPMVALALEGIKQAAKKWIDERKNGSAAAA